MSLALFSQHYSLSGRTIVVLGGASDVGVTLAEALARSGADLIIAGRSEARGHACVESVRSCGGVGGFAAVDLRDQASIAALVEYALGEYGKVDGLLQVASPTWKPDWLVAAAPAFQAAMQQQSQGGVVVNVAPRPWAKSSPPPPDSSNVQTPPTHTLWTPPLDQAADATAPLETMVALALVLLRHGRDLQGSEMTVATHRRTS